MVKLEIIKNKIYCREVLLKQVAIWRLNSKRIVFTNGCFDLLHRGHIDYLSRAADLGDVLVLGLNSDVSIKKLNKGTNRPIQKENDRALVLASLQFINAVILFEEATPCHLIEVLQPDVLVKGGDWKEDAIVGADMVKANGGLVTILPFVEGYSTTAIEHRIKNS